MINDMRHMNVPVFKGISDASEGEQIKKTRKSLSPEVPKGKFAEA
jgi:hypothetical protein